MVDELRLFPGAKPPFHRGSCHLTVWPQAFADLVRLHDFAAQLGMKREWFQRHHSAPHYDLTPARRADALKLGATFVPAKEQARRRKATTSTQHSSMQSNPQHPR
jgi:hypothetical protein